MQSPKNKQEIVLSVNGSLNNRDAITENTITPNPNPNNLLGQISPLNANIKFLTDCMNMYDIGNPISTRNHVLFFSIAYLTCPCSCRNVTTCASNPHKIPYIRFMI